MGSKIIPIIAVCIGLCAAGGQVSASPDAGKTASTTNAANGIFGSHEMRLELPAAGTKIARLFDKIDQEQLVYSTCERDRRTCPDSVRSWRDSVEQFRSLDGVELLAAVNDMANHLIEYKDDLANHGRLDYWATPMESLSGFGDCEDFALLKYVTLRELGIGDEHMRIAVVMDVERGIGHAVLTVKMGARTFVLDNTFSRPRLDSDLAHYRPLYSLNNTAQWLNIEARDGTAGPQRTQPAAAKIMPGAPGMPAIMPAEDSAAAQP